MSVRYNPDHAFGFQGPLTLASEAMIVLHDEGSALERDILASAFFEPLQLARAVHDVPFGERFDLLVAVHCLYL